MTTVQEGLIKEGLGFITTQDEQAKSYTREELYDYLVSSLTWINSDKTLNLEETLTIIENRWFEFDQQLNELYTLTTKQEENVLTANESERYMALVNTLHDNQIAIPFAIEY